MGTLGRWGRLGILPVTLGSFAVAALLAPAGRAEPGILLGALVVFGYVGHVAATAWLGLLPEIRANARAHPARFLLAPGLLVAGAAAVTAAVPTAEFGWLLLGYFAWQFVHFQKQNLGLVALSGSARRAPSLRPAERRAVLAAGGCGIAGLLAHPALLGLTVDTRLGPLFPVAGLALAATIGAGVVVLARRSPGERPAAFVGSYLAALCFFAPVFLFASPFAAVGGMVLAHGFQYLSLLRLLAAGNGPAQSREPSRPVRLALLANAALAGGIGLNALSQLHRNPGLVPRALYGAYLGLVMAHFVVDARIWRLRDEFPRAFLSGRLPGLVGPAPQVPAAS